jgi:hypothetical protein
MASAISGTATAGSARHWEVLGYPAACKDRGTVVPIRIPGSCCRCELGSDWVTLTARSHAYVAPPAESLVHIRGVHLAFSSVSGPTLCGRVRKAGRMVPAPPGLVY